MTEPIFPERISDEQQFDAILTRPSSKLVEMVHELSEGLLILGVGGKIGHTLAVMAKRAAEAAGIHMPIVGVSRFTDHKVKGKLQAANIETIRCNLLDQTAINRLPKLPNVVFMVGRKFGSTDDKPLTWVMNSYIPGLIAQRFTRSRILVFSTGNIYPFTPCTSQGASEDTPPSPIGEYAQSSLGRERVFEYFSRENDTPLVIIRLNYSIELRYGVLLDIAEAVWNGRPIDRGMPCVNVIWQGDVSDMVLRAIPLATVPPEVINIAGPEVVSVIDLAEQFGDIMHREPRFVGKEYDTALLSDSSKARQLLGKPTVSLNQMVHWVADWVMNGGPTLGKPTHFTEREGQF